MRAKLRLAAELVSLPLNTTFLSWMARGSGEADAQPGGQVGAWSWGNQKKLEVVQGSENPSPSPQRSSCSVRLASKES